MKRIIQFSDGIVSGDDMRSVLRIIPYIKANFKQRKQYDEYYFEATEVEFNSKMIDELSYQYFIELTCDNLTIRI